MVLVENIRNVALVSQSNTGKSSLVASLLTHAKAIQKISKKEESHLISDFTQEEKERNFTHTIKMFNFSYDKFSFNLIDTPGYPDFIGEVISALAAVDGVIFVLDATGNIEVQTEQIWHMVQEKSLPHLVFVNKMDREEADFTKVLKELEEKLNKQFVLVQMPQSDGGILKEGVDLISEPEAIPSEMLEYREKLVESVAETDDSLVEKYLEVGKLTLDEIKKGLKIGVKQGTFSPVVCGSTYADIGIDYLVKFLIDFFPTPIEKKVLDKDGKLVDIIDIKDSLAQVFKVTSELHLGDVVLFRVFSGRFSASSLVYNVSRDLEEKFGQKIQIVKGHTKDEVDSVGPGEIAGIAKLKATKVSDTLSNSRGTVVLKSLEFPSPNTSVAVVPKESKDEEKLSFALDRLVREDPTLRIGFNKEIIGYIYTG